MKKMMCAVLIAALALATACSMQDTTPAVSVIESVETYMSAVSVPKESAGDMVDESMTISSEGIENGVIAPAYGSHGEMTNGVPVVSIPLFIQNTPEGTAYFAVYMEDPDSEPICGYVWVHWMAVNIGENDLPEDFSRTAGAPVVQGTNDFGTVGYGGPTPPDKDHTYRLTVYALDAAVDLTEGFGKADFTEAIKGHVLARAEIEGLYKK